MLTIMNIYGSWSMHLLHFWDGHFEHLVAKNVLGIEVKGS